MSGMRTGNAMRDNRTGETEGFREFDNNFCMGDFADQLSNVVAAGTAGAFRERVAHVQRTYALENLQG